MAKNKSSSFLYILIGFLVYLVFTYLLFLAEDRIEESNIHSMGDAFWFTIVTLTTVGYGDFYPTSLFGRLVGLVFVLGSVGVIGYLISQLTSQVANYRERKRLGYMGTNFENHILIIGWDDFGQQVAHEVINSGKQVAIVTSDKDDIDLIHEAFPANQTFALFTALNNYAAFDKVNIEKTASIFINLKDDAEALIYVLNLRDKYPKLSYVVSLNNPSLRETFVTAGVRYVVSKNEMASRMVASYTFEPDVAEMAEALMTTALKGQDYDMQEYLVTEQNPYVSKDYLDAFIDLKVNYDCVLLGISKKQENKWVLKKNPSKGTEIQVNDYLILMCDGDVKRKIESVFQITEGRNGD